MNELKVYAPYDYSHEPDKCPSLVYDKFEVDKVIAKKDNEIRRLKRALYKACANWAKSKRYTEATWHGDEHREELWAEVQDKCIKKAEEYK